MHIHDKGSCVGADFKSAGDHFNPEDKEHGLMHPEGAHAGDLPNIIVKEDGTVKAELTAPSVTWKRRESFSLTKDGTSIVIHDRKDMGCHNHREMQVSGLDVGKLRSNKWIHSLKERTKEKKVNLPLAEYELLLFILF